MPNVMVALPNIGGALCSTRKAWLAPSAEVPYSNAANGRAQDLEDANWILHLPKFRHGATAAESVYIAYQPRRRPNIMQRLVRFRWATSLQ